MKHLLILFLSLVLISCNRTEPIHKEKPSNPYIFVLGVAQDAGYPQINCKKECCQRVYENPKNGRFVSSLALVDPISNQEWVFDATPDFSEQIKLLNNQINSPDNLPDGIFLTHAHIGHYTGLMYLGHEAMGTKNVPVYTMPRMKKYLETNGPWSQLVNYKNIKLKRLQKDSIIVLNNRISVKPILVPHRDEYSETVGYEIQVYNKKLLFIPDIDKWNKWEKSISEYISRVDIAFLDATFYKSGEINRDMEEVPHPFVEESMNVFTDLSETDKSKVYFIHFNHTNPLLINGSPAQKTVLQHGFNIALQEMIIKL